MFKTYFLNFWIWWYGVQFKTILRLAYSFWSLTLANLNIVPMLSNLFVPMFQDDSPIGKFLSLIVRLGWVLFGVFVQLFVTIPVILFVLIWVIFPLLCLFQLIRVFI
jgi:hypothetical protein